MAATKAKISQDSKTVAERESASVAGLSIVQYRILKAIARSKTGRMNYREIEKATGYYSVLTAQLRATTARGNSFSENLGTKKLVREEQHEDEPLSFAITAKGRKLLEKVKD